MSSLNSLTELLKESGTQFRIYDMGRQISEIPASEFSDIERGNRVYPKPYLHQAWMALFLWDPSKSEQNVVWFLKFPLDEQGYLVQAVRDDFINRLMLNINQILDCAEISEAEDALKDNPFSFTPDQEKMAAFHAITAAETKTPNSQYYTQCQQYFSGKLAWDKWQELGVQGIAEVAININSTATQDDIVKYFDQYAQAPLIALCNSLENTKIDTSLAEKITSTLKRQLTENTPNITLCSSLLRAIYSAPDDSYKQECILSVLNSTLDNTAELLTTIAVKLSNQLLNDSTIYLFLEKLSISEAGQNGFSRILADLMFQEELRQVILTSFRNPNRSDELTRAIGAMFGGKF